MDPLMIGGITSKGQGNPHGTTAGDRRVETGSPFSGATQSTDCSSAIVSNKSKRDSRHRKGCQKLRAASSYVGKQAITRHVQISKRFELKCLLSIDSYAVRPGSPIDGFDLCCGGSDWIW
ncbi:hypothetical protein Tco_0201671 [Tanacetum coccineum]